MAGGGLEEAFRTRFGAELPETLNGEHSMLIVGSLIDESSERIIRYLSDRHGVKHQRRHLPVLPEPDGGELVARVFLHRARAGRALQQRQGHLEEAPQPDATRSSTERAGEAGVRELYEHAVAALEPLLKNRTTLLLDRLHGEGRRRSEGRSSA